jgi:hypothetical protein
MDDHSRSQGDVMEMFSSQSKARIVHLRMKLNQIRNKNKTGPVYFGQIKSLADEMNVDCRQAS